MAADESDKGLGRVSRGGVIPSGSRLPSLGEISKRSGGIIKPREAEQSTRESTGDPVRDSIIAQGKERSAIDELYEHNLAAEKEALAARFANVAQEAQWQPPTEEQFNHDWFRPAEAVNLLLPAGFGDEVACCRWLINRLRVGEIIAVARNAYLSNRLHGRFFAIPANFWATWNDLGDEFFWNSGDAVFHVDRPRTIPPQATYQCHDVRFESVGFGNISLSIRPTIEDDGAQEAAKSTTLGRQVGRPAKQFWEPLLIEMARQLYNGDLKPQRQADVESAMHEWLIANGFQAGETQVRERARKLWQQIEK